MHFEILIEDASGKKLLEIIVPKIIDTTEHTFKVISYKGIGRLPKDLRTHQDPAKRILLEQLPKLLRGYGKNFQNYDNAAVIIVVDCDKRNCVEFKNELLKVLSSCNPSPKALFRIAIEEMEAWLLGDEAAITSAYRSTKKNVIDTYVQDSICGTWEKLADAIYPGGSAALQKTKKKSYYEIGCAKCEWAENIGNYMNVENNLSKSFKVFRDCFIKLIK